MPLRRALLPDVAALHALALPIHTVPAATPLVRMHTYGKEPLYFPHRRNAHGRPEPAMRFDDPLSDYGVCYFGFGDGGAFVETILRDQYLQDLTRADLEVRALADGRAVRPLRLARMSGKGLQRIHTHAGVVHLDDYRITQAWSRAVFTHPDRPDGIMYRSRFDDDEICVALFEPACDAVSMAAGPCILTLPSRLKALLEAYEITLHA